MQSAIAWLAHTSKRKVLAHDLVANIVNHESARRSFAHQTHQTFVFVRVRAEVVYSERLGLWAYDFDHLVNVFVSEHRQNGTEGLLAHQRTVHSGVQYNCGCEVAVFMSSCVSNYDSSLVVSHQLAETVGVELVYHFAQAAFIFLMHLCCDLIFCGSMNHAVVK